MSEVLRSDAVVVDAIERIALRWGVEDELDPDFKRELIHHFSTIPVCKYCRKPKADAPHWQAYEGVQHVYEPLDKTA